MSLKKLLHEKIENQGYLSLDEIYQICQDNFHKPDNATRRLRELTSAGKIKPVYNETHKYIKGYEPIRQETFIIKPENKPAQLFNLRPLNENEL